MTSQNRFLKSAAATAAETVTEAAQAGQAGQITLPFQRGAARQAMIARRKPATAHLQRA